MKDAAKEKQQRDKKVSSANSGNASSNLNSSNNSNASGNSSNASSSNGATIKMEPSDGPMTPMKVGFSMTI